MKLTYFALISTSQGSSLLQLSSSLHHKCMPHCHWLIHHNQGQCIPKISMVLWKKLVLCLIYFKQSKWRTQSYRVVEYIQLSIKEKKVQISGIHNTVKQIKSFILFSISLAISKMWFTMSQLKENPFDIIFWEWMIQFYFIMLKILVY